MGLNLRFVSVGIVRCYFEVITLIKCRRTVGSITPHGGITAFYIPKIYKEIYE